VKHSAGAALFVTGVASPTLNCVFVTGPDAPPQEVDDLLSIVAMRGLPYSLQLRPGVGPELEALARDRGMRAEGSVPLMVLERPAATIEQVAENPGLVFRKLASKECGLHASILASGFGAPVELFEQLITPALLLIPGVGCYVGTVDGLPVTTALGFTDRDNVGIYNVATVPGQRGHGYGGAVTVRTVLDGFAAGASVAYLQSSEEGYGVYERLGFRTLEKWRVWISSTD
jgi:hypothetical protein